jgi:hypothetical protein
MPAANLGYTPERTLNRLFQKHLGGHQKKIADNSPWLSSDNVVVTEEQWPTAALKALAPGTRASLPRHTDFPVVIVRYRNRNCLIDGGKRIHYWHASGSIEDHPAYVLTVRNGDAVS